MRKSIRYCMNKCFIDTSGFYSLLVQNDPYHDSAQDWLNKVCNLKERIWTSDYVLDETATLLKFRKMAYLCNPFFSLVEASRALSVLYVDSNLFAKSKDYFIKHQDQKYSFTDCTSFVVMQENRIKDALTHDHHFRQAGFSIVLIA